ncbi:MAG: glycosyltransferase family 2 protein [Flavobacteriales bacterium]
MEITVVTPSFNMLGYLQRARASVADQQGVAVEHIVADGGSADGTVEWLAAAAEPMEAGAPRPAQGSVFRYFSGKDAGMYDALNKGFASASGQVVAWLNCDEQYLEGALAYARDRFRQDPRLDILFGGALLVRPDGTLLAARKAYPARAAWIASAHLYNLSCATFFSRRLFDRGLRFDTRFRNLGDHDLFLRALRMGARTAMAPRPLAAFAFTGGNLSWSEGARREAEVLKAERPAWMKVLHLPLNALRLASKALHGGYWHGPVHYGLYPEGDLSARKRFSADRVPVKWPNER